MRIIIIENANAAILSQILSNPSYNRSNIFTENNSENDSDNCPLLDAVEKATGFRIEDHGVSSPGMEPEPIKFENDSKEFWSQSVQLIVNSYVDTLQSGEVFSKNELEELIYVKKLEFLKIGYSKSGLKSGVFKILNSRKDITKLGYGLGYRKN